MSQTQKKPKHKGKQKQGDRKRFTILTAKLMGNKIVICKQCKSIHTLDRRKQVNFLGSITQRTGFDRDTTSCRVCGSLYFSEVSLLDYEMIISANIGTDEDIRPDIILESFSNCITPVEFIKNYKQTIIND